MAIADTERNAKRGGRVRIGTSGWVYAGWRGPFYPREVPSRRWLRYYATCFSTTEINGSFYRTPSLEAVQAWVAETPGDFTFAWKASKFITHWKRLTAKCANSLALMETRLEILAPRVSAVLFQLPPRFPKDKGRLDGFLDMLRPGYRYAFEFRHRTWYADDILDILRERGVALCISDHEDAPSPWEVTASHVYVRGHGPGGRYRGSYSAMTLGRWADAITAWAGQQRDVLVYFDNDQKAAAPGDARRLMRLTGIAAGAQAVEDGAGGPAGRKLGAARSG